MGKQIFASESQISAIEALKCLERAPFLDIWKEEGEREFPSRIEIREILRTILSILERLRKTPNSGLVFDGSVAGLTGWTSSQAATCAIGWTGIIRRVRSPPPACPPPPPPPRRPPPCPRACVRKRARERERAIFQSGQELPEEHLEGKEEDCDLMVDL